MDNTRVIIAFGHKARQGKDTAAEYLVDRYGFVRLSFADALKDEVSVPGGHLISIVENDSRGYIIFRDGECFDIYDRELNIDMYNSFLDYMKRNAEETANVHGFNIYLKNPMVEKDRELLQLWGTDYKRAKFGDDYWITKIADKISHNPKTNFAISDLRFKNEADFVKTVGGINVCVSGRELIAESTHESEADLNDYLFDEYIDNSLTLYSYYSKIDDLIFRIKHGI